MLFKHKHTFLDTTPNRRSFSKRLKAFSLTALIVLSSVVALPFFSNSKVSALSTSTADPSAYESQIASYLYYASIKYCLQYSNLRNDPWFGDESISDTDASSGKWFKDSQQKVTPGIYMNNAIQGMATDGTTYCSNSSLVNNALNFWSSQGASGMDVESFLCSSGFKRKDNSDCKNSTADFVRDGDKANSANLAKEYIKKQVYGGGDIPTPSGAQLYIFYRHSLDERCVPGIDGSLEPKASSNDMSNPIKVLNWVKLTGGKAESIGGYYDSSLSNLDDSTYVTLTNSDHYKCSEIAQNMSNYADDYISVYNAWAKQNPEIAKTVEEQQKTNSSETSTTNGSCSIPGIGWIICPVTNFLAKIADSAFSYISKEYLEVSPSVLSTDSDTYKAWSSMRSIANVAFVIAFLIIIFSQTTNIGISNYCIKKLLPRLVIAAILVNLSYFVCQIAVDLSNIVGYSIQQTLTNIIPDSKTAAGIWSGGTFWTNTAGSILFIGAGAAIAWSSLAALIPILLAAVVALVMILFILVARQVLIILLIVVSPIAFVAFLLPNTSGMFTKWRKTFTTMLLLFPIVGAVFGISKLASNILTPVFYTDDNDKLGGIIIASILVLPLFVVPSILKKSMDSVGNIGSMMNNLGNKAGGWLGGKSSEAFKNTSIARGREARSRYRQMYRDQTYAENLSKGGLTRRLARGVSGNLGLTASDRFANARLDSFAQAAADKLDEEAVSNRVTAIRGEVGPGNLDDVKSNLVNAISAGDSVEARANQRILLSSGGKGKDTLHDVLRSTTENPQNASTLKSMRSAVLASGIKGSDAVLDRWGATGGNIEDIEKDTSVLSGLSAEELAGQSYKKVLLATGGVGITKEAAQSLLNNPNATRLLNDEKRQFFEKIAGTYKAGDSSTINTPPKAPGI